MIYLDHAATCPLRREALEAMMPYLTDQTANPSSQHGPGRAVKKALETARLKLAEPFSVPMGAVYFTSSGTEADNLAIWSAYKRREKGPGHLVTTAFEHEAVLEIAHYLETLGVEVSYIKPDAHGMIDPDEVARAVREDTFLVSVMAINNELGTVQPIRDIAEAIGSVPLHVDAVQAAGHEAIEHYAVADYIALSGHKFYGPKGAGALISRLPLSPRIVGGGQERGIRSGTENVAAIVGMVEAFRLAEAEREEESLRIEGLVKAMRKGLASMDGVSLTTPYGGGRVVHVMVEGIERDVLLFQLDRAGFAVSGGSACQAGASQSSHVLQAMGIDEAGRAPLRISFGRENTPEDVAAFERELRAILERKRS